MHIFMHRTIKKQNAFMVVKPESVAAVLIRVYITTFDLSICKFEISKFHFQSVVEATDQA